MSTLHPAGTVAGSAVPAKKEKSRWEEQLLTGSGGAALALLVLCVALTIYSPFFLTKDNLLNVIDQVTVLGILALGMTAVIIIGGIDLSVGAVLALAMMVLGWLSHEGGLPVSLAIVGALAAGAAAGAVNGVMTTKAKLPAFIATLAMFSIARGLALLLNDKLPVSLLDLNGGSFGDPRAFSLLWFGTGRILGLPVSVYVFLLVTIVGWVVLNRTRYGRYVVAVGGNREAARIAGVPVRRVILSVYILSGLCVAIATVLLCARLGSASPVSGNLYELDAIGAVVIGGTSLAGGRATIVGTFLGVLTFGLIFSLMTQMNLSTEVQQVVKGAIVLGAVLLQRPEARY
jgi:ribose transport system permease protein